MRLGLTPWLISGRVDAGTLARQGALAEAWGYESIWLPENHFTGDAAIPDPLMLLAAIAAGTERIRLGTTSYLLPLRHPLQAAEQVAVLDRMSNGRVILGVGRGYQPAMFDAFSVSRKDKRRIFKWCLDIMMRAWQGEEIVMEPDAPELLNGKEPVPVKLSPLPVQKPYPPIWVAAFGPKALAQAGSLGAPYLASPMEPVERLKENYARHALACDEAGAERPEEIPVMRTVFVSDDQRLLARLKDELEIEARSAASSGIRKGMSLAPDDWAIVGDRAEVKDKIARYEEEVGMNYLVVTRLRIGKVDSDLIERSVATVAEILA